MGKQKIVSKVKNDDGSIKIITSANITENGKKGTFYFTYEFDSNNYTVKKEAQYNDSDERILKNVYVYRRLN